MFPALIKILTENSNVRLVLVPHQPVPKAISRIEEEFDQWGVQRFSRRELLENENILVVDGVGFLAGLYHHANAAYVGGSFHQGIHNVMEPAIFGIPVFYGPVHENSYEAIQLAQNNGGNAINNSEELYRSITLILKDKNVCKTEGEKAEKFATRNTGATELLLSRWEKLLNAKDPE